MKAKTAIFAGLLAALTVGCGERDVILTGERSEIREGMAPFVNQVAPVNDAVPRVNAAWSQRNGGPDHKIAHPALAANLTQVLAVNIGEGDSRRARITAEPVVAGGVIYTLDARARVTATATSGAPVWAVDVTPGRDRATDASGGGVSVAGGRVFVTTGFGELTALDAATGRALWTQDLDAPGTSAPTILGDLVYVVARNSTAWALDVNTGRTEWQISGTPSVANFGGGAGVAVNDDIALFPFSSGERSGQAATVVSDISADPVISGDRAYVGNFGGQLAALDLAKGERIWTAREGAMGPVWPAGNAVFLVNDLNQLVRLNAATGAPVWRVDLPQTEQSNRKRAKAANYGPILAGGRLIVASSLGNLLHYDPTSGALIATTPIAGGAATNPVVAGGTLYVISKEGQLLAFR